MLQFQGRTVVCDAGVHPALSGIASLPFIDALDWSTVDAILITQYDILFTIQKADDVLVFTTIMPLR